MQNVQNSDTQRVINLVNTYRTQMREKHLTRDLSKKEIEYLEQNGGKGITKVYLGIDAKKIDVYCFNEQLLGHFYAIVAGSNAEKDILQQLLPDFYDTTIYTQDEEVFLKEHFREMVNYIIQTPLNDWDEEANGYHDNSSKIEYLIPEEILNLIGTRVQIPNDAVSYNLFAGLGQFAVRFNGRKVLWSTDDAFLDWHEELFCKTVEESYEGVNLQTDSKNWYKRTNSWIRSYAWARVAMYANNVRAHRVEDGDSSFNYNVLMAYIPFSSHYMDGTEMVKKTHEAYNHLKEGGKMILLCPNSLLWKKSSEESMFRELLVKDCSIEEIIQLPSSVMKSDERDFCIIIAEKGRERTCTTFIDATKAFKPKRIYSEEDAHRNDYNVLDVEAWNTLLQNNGIEQETGLHKIAQLKSSTLNPNMLLPQICVLEKPSENEKPLPLSKLCNRVVSKVKEIGHDLPTDTLWVRKHNLSNAFQGALNVSILETADCPNNPPHTNDYKFAETGEFIDKKDFKSPFMGNHDWAGLGQQTEIGMRVVDYRRCTFIDGTKGAVLFKQQGDGVSVTLIRATGKPIAIDSEINVFVPNDDIDALSLVALLRLPIVYRQICAYEKFGLSNYMDDILVPTDLRIIRDEERSLKDEQETYKAQQEKFESMKTEYINEVRMRKHDMGQYVFELNQIEDSIRYYIDNRDKEKDFCQHIENLLDTFKASVGELSTLLNNLSKEEQFGEPERFDLHEFLSHIGERHGTEEYVIKYECDIKSIIDYNIHRQKELDNYMLNQEIEDAIAQQEMDDYLINQEIEDAIAQQEMDDYLINQEIEDAIAQQEMKDSFEGEEAYVFDETQVNDEEPYMVGENQAVDDASYVFEETHVNSDESYVVGEFQVVDDEAYVFEETQVDDDEPYMVDDTQAVDGGAYVMDGVWGKYLTSIPQSYIAPNDIQRLVINILDNAREHGFTDSERNDYEVDVKLSIDTKLNMFQIDFRNNGNPLSDGIDKMRYGLLGEKAGKTGGTGIGGNYVKKFVEHYGGDYDVFMDNRWVVIRIYIPIK